MGQVLFFGGILSVFASHATARSLERLEAITSRAATLDQFLSSPALLDEYSAALQRYYGASRFNCQSFREVVDELRGISKRVPALAESIWRPWDSKTSALILSEDGVAFNFRSVPRKFHAIWSYTSKAYCDNEVCSNLFKDNRNRGSVLLGRWAVALSGSQVHLIEKDGVYSGMAVLLTPYQKEGEVYGLIDGYGDRSRLVQTIRYKEKTGKIVETNVLEAWVDKLSTFRPAWLKGLLLAAETDSEASAPLTRAFPPTRLRPVVEDAYVPLDSAAGMLSQHLGRQCGLSAESSRKLTPSAVANVGAYFEVVPSPFSSFTASIPVGSPVGAGGGMLDAFSGETGNLIAKSFGGAGTASGSKGGGNGLDKKNFGASSPKGAPGGQGVQGPGGSTPNGSIGSGKPLGEGGLASLGNLFGLSGASGASGHDAASPDDRARGVGRFDKKAPEKRGADGAREPEKEFPSRDPGQGNRADAQPIDRAPSGIPTGSTPGGLVPNEPEDAPFGNAVPGNPDDGAIGTGITDGLLGSLDPRTGDQPRPTRPEPPAERPREDDGTGNPLPPQERPDVAEPSQPTDPEPPGNPITGNPRGPGTVEPQPTEPVSPSRAALERLSAAVDRGEKITNPKEKERLVKEVFDGIGKISDPKFREDAKKTLAKVWAQGEDESPQRVMIEEMGRKDLTSAQLDFVRDLPEEVRVLHLGCEKPAEEKAD